MPEMQNGESETKLIVKSKLNPVVCAFEDNIQFVLCLFMEKKTMSFDKLAGDLIKNKIFMIILIMGIVFTSVLLLSNYTRIEVLTEPQNDLQPQYLPPKERFLDGKLDFLNFKSGFSRVNLIEISTGCHHVYLDVGTNIGIQVTKKLKNYM